MSTTSDQPGLNTRKEERAATEHASDLLPGYRGALTGRRGWMSLQAMVWALKTVDLTGDPIAKLVLLGLADHAQADGSASWPTQKVLAEYANVSARTVRTKLRSLEELGLIQPGDQEIVSHIRADRRPPVYDLNLREEGISGRKQASSREEGTGGSSVPPVEVPRAEIETVYGRKLLSHKPKEEPVRDLVGGQSLPRDSARGQRLDPTWIPDQPLITEMKAERPDLDLKAEHAKFVDYWVSKPGKEGRKLDWRRTWRNWMRNAKAPANGHTVAKPVQRRILCAVCQKPEIACRRVAKQTGDDHDWTPQEVKA